MVNFFSMVGGGFSFRADFDLPRKTLQAVASTITELRS